MRRCENDDYGIRRKPHSNSSLVSLSDTILDLLTDPMEAARKEQMERAQREIDRARDEQRRRLRELEAHVDAAKDAAAPSSSSSSGIDARVEQLADKASHKKDAPAKKTPKHAVNKQRLEAEQQLHRDFEERAAEESAALALRMAKLEEERASRLEREIAVLRANHDAAFQHKVESEVAKRLHSVDAKVKARREAELASSAAHDAAINADGAAAAAAAAAAPAVSDENAVLVELTASTTHAMPGDSVTVTWRFKRGAPTSRDWLALYKASRPHDSKQYYLTQYTDGEATGQATFVVPAKLGVCEFRFFQRGDYKVVSRSAALHVGPRVELTARIEGSTVVVRKRQVSGTPSSYDWVALFDEAQTDGKAFVGAYAYIATDADATALLKLPKTPGRYVVRFFAGSSGYSPLATSNVVAVDNNDRVVAAPASVKAGAKGALSVTCHCESVDAHKSNWIALFAADDQDNHNFVGSYAYCAAFDKPVQFDAPDKAGRYVARLFERGSFKLIRQSNEFTVSE
jgi:hypothetical protein